MSIFGLGKQKPGSDPASIKQRLETVKGELAQLEAEHATASYQWAIGEATSRKEVDRIDGALLAARRDQRALEAALRLAEEEVRRQERERAAGVRKTQINALTRHARTSEQAAERFTAAMETAVKEYKAILASRAKVRAACPVGSVWPGGVARCGDGEVRQMIELEILRLSVDDAKLGDTGFPGGSKAAVISNGENPLASPATFKSLADVLKRTDDWLIGYFKNGDKFPSIDTPVLDEPVPAPVTATSEPDPSEQGAPDPFLELDPPKPMTEAERIAFNNPPKQKLGVVDHRKT